jgi:hypothetical protein
MQVERKTTSLFNRLDPRQTLIVFCYKLFLRAALLGCMCSFLPSTVLAQEPGISSGETLKQPAPGNEELSLAPAKVNVKPVNRDEEILKRLQNVLDATEWFIDPKVRVEEGVVFLSGQADSFGRSTINLRVYFWLNGRENSWLKVRSSVIRLIKRAFQKNGISIPDEGREVVFPRGVPIVMPDSKTGEIPVIRPEKPVSTESEEKNLDAVSTKAEAGLYSEAGAIEEQAQQVKPLQDEENLLEDTPKPQ